MTVKMSKKAYVFGAGVAGLTAAHELAERGFAVTVIESQQDPRDRSKPLLGGLAATQWARLPAPTLPEDLDRSHSWLRKGMRRVMPSEGAQVDLGMETPVDPGSFGVAVSEYLGGRAIFDPGNPAMRAARVERVASILTVYLDSADDSVEEVWIGVGNGVGADPSGLFQTGMEVGEDLVAALEKEMESSDFGRKIQKVSAPDWQKTTKSDGGIRWMTQVKIDDKMRLRIYVVLLDATESSTPPNSSSAKTVVVRFSEQLLPGEHGYRFFPSFYANLFDTLRRIPLLREKKPPHPSIRGFSDDFPNAADFFRGVEVDFQTVFDNLVSIDRHVFATQGGRAPVELERTQIPSLSAVRRLLDASQGLLKFEAGDLVRGQLALLRFLLSSEPRRRLLERTSWNDYADASGGSDAYREALEKWPQALVGLRGGRADARAFGTAAVQLGLDQVRPGSFRDASLAGPTTSMWFDPWKKFLTEYYKVEFSGGSLNGIYPKKAGLEFDFSSFLNPWGANPIPTDAYIVLALPLAEMADLAAGLGDRILASCKDVSASVNDLISSASNKDIRSFCSSPFFQLTTLRLNHRDYAEGEREFLRRSPNGASLKNLTFTRQHAPAPVDDASDVSKEKSPFRHFAGIQFFLEEDFPGARGHVYYVDSPWGLSSISPVQYRRERLDQGSIWHGMVSVIVGIWDRKGMNGSLPHQCTPQEFAEEVWAQIRQAFQGSPNPAPERPLAYHIDEGLEYRDKKWTNKTPFLTNVVGLADWWPEEPGRYQVYFDRVVFCGTWLRTWTRLVTMEAANESARHAVNAILEDFAVHGEDPHTIAGCMVSNPEEHEIEDLGWFKRLDAELCARNLPHLFEILGIDAAVLGKAGDGRGGVIQAITEHVRTSGELGRGVADALTRTLTTLFERYGLG